MHLIYSYLCGFVPGPTKYEVYTSLRTPVLKLFPCGPLVTITYSIGNFP